MASQPTVSVICNTLNRADALADLLAALRQLTYPNFEVVVVVGPCTDHTLEVLAPYEGEVKVVRCEVPNLSMSRNLGIVAAAGEVVAFIDDDGIPEPSWLDELVAGYADDPEDEVAGVGGVVRDHTGYTFQCRFNTANRYGSGDPFREVPMDAMCFPGAFNFPYLIGTNSSFRRDRLVAVGGFDEEIEFYLDETDVCARLVDAGFVLRQLEGAEVHHKFLPSGVRNPHKVTVDNYAVVKNKIYFSLLHSPSDLPFDQAMADNANFARMRREDLAGHYEAGNLSLDDYRRGLATIEAAWPAGLAAGARGRTTMIDPVAAAAPPAFLPYRTVRPEGRRLHLVMVTQSLPPHDMGGIGRYLLDTARELAGRGHEVRIVTTGEDHPTVDLEQGVWVHRMLKDGPQPPSGLHELVPDRVWRNAGAVADEVLRVHRRRPVDVVMGAMWDVETAAVLERTGIPVVTTLVTTLGITLRTRPEWLADEGTRREFVEPMLDLERWLIEHSHLVHAISSTILDEAVEVAGATVDLSAAKVVPLGVVDHGGPRAEAGGDGPVVLFVGRFEKRKGIDLLLDAVPAVLAQHPTARFVLIGRNDLPGEHGEPYVEAFARAHADDPWWDRVELRGVVDDTELWDAYRSCDVFVAPSRFESFGLVYVEAMMAGKPVVALDAGAATEVLDHRETGLLVAPESDGLAAAILELLADDALCRQLGAAGRAEYERRYTDTAMGDGIEAMLMGLLEELAP